MIDFFRSERRSALWDRITNNCTVSNDRSTWWTDPETDKSSPCWEWQGGDSGDGRGGGYGRISIDGFTQAVHRVIYQLIHGPLHPSRQVDHKCKNRKCCNPEHLEDCTHKQNQKRRDRRNGC